MNAKRMSHNMLQLKFSDLHCPIYYPLSTLHMWVLILMIYPYFIWQAVHIFRNGRLNSLKIKSMHRETERGEVS